MTMHPTPAERLLALLDDEQTFETLPAGDVRADLDSVGINPARCVAFARALAAGGDSPGRQLLGAIDMAENEEDEIARLESADIDEVRAQIPGGTAAAIAAEARRKAGADSNVVAIRARRRRRILYWGGPAAGIAASVLLFAVVGVQFLDNRKQESFSTPSYISGGSGGERIAELGERKDEDLASAPPQAEKRGFESERDEVGFPKELAPNEFRAAEAPVVAAAPPASEPSGDVAANVEETIVQLDKGYTDSTRQQGAGGADSGGRAEPSAGLLAPGDSMSTARELMPEAEKKKADVEQDVAAADERLAGQKLQANQTPAQSLAQAPAAPDSGVGGNVIEEGAALADRFYAEQRPEGGEQEDAKTLTESEGFVAKPRPSEETLLGKAEDDTSMARSRSTFATAPVTAPVTAMAVVDPSQVPLAVQSQALPDAGLSARIDEARRLAGGRPVIALYRVGIGEQRQDFAQLPLQLGKSQQQAAPSPLAGLLGADAANYDFVALPESP